MQSRSVDTYRASRDVNRLENSVTDEVLDFLTEEAPAGPLVAFRDYRIISEVARGGMGVVYSAWQSSLGRRVALKVLPVDRMDDSSAVARFRREARIAAHLHHPNIVEVFETGVVAGTPYFAMEFVNGEPLQRLERRWQGKAPDDRSDTGCLLVDDGVWLLPGNGSGWSQAETRVLTRNRMPKHADEGCAPGESRRNPGGGAEAGTARGNGPSEDAAVLSFPGRPLGFLDFSDNGLGDAIVLLLLGVAEGLEYAHSRGIVHRDLKPSNLILETDGRLRIIDFGLACLEGHDDGSWNHDLMGTPAYMSPEQAQGLAESLERGTDIYSFGATAYELLGGQPPFEGQDCRETLEKVIHTDPAPLRSLNPRVPRWLEAIVMKCLRKAPRERYATARQLARDLKCRHQSRSVVPQSVKAVS